MSDHITSNHIKIETKPAEDQYRIYEIVPKCKSDDLECLRRHVVDAYIDVDKNKKYSKGDIAITLPPTCALVNTLDQKDPSRITFMENMATRRDVKKIKQKYIGAIDKDDALKLLSSKPEKVVDEVKRELKSKYSFPKEYICPRDISYHL